MSGQDTERIDVKEMAALDGVNQMRQMKEYLHQIATSLNMIAQASLPAEPNYRYPFEAYTAFDWSSIGARVVASDQYGATKVQWGGYANWTRRFAPTTKTRKQSIWFSRAAAAEDADGTEWFTLITFRDLAAAEPLPNGLVVANPRPLPPPQRRDTAPIRATAKEKDEKQSPPNQITDWHQEALSCSDELMFDSAVARWLPYFPDEDMVKLARESICGKWNAEKVQQIAVSLEKYSNIVQSNGTGKETLQEKKVRALEEARQIFRG